MASVTTEGKQQEELSNQPDHSLWGLWHFSLGLVGTWTWWDDWEGWRVLPILCPDTILWEDFRHTPPRGCRAHRPPWHPLLQTQAPYLLACGAWES